MMDLLGEFYYLQGAGLARQGKITTAISALETAVTLKRDSWQAWNLLGLCYYRQGKFQLSCSAWGKSLSVMSRENPALGYISDLETESFRKLIDRYNEALNLAKNGRYKRAGDILQRGWQKGPPFVSFANLLGLCRYGHGKRIDALKFWLYSLNLDRDNPDTIDYLKKALDWPEGPVTRTGRLLSLFRWLKSG
jgi:tetratricopeptide (TPR) repeat protein